LKDAIAVAGEVERPLVQRAYCYVCLKNHDGLVDWVANLLLGFCGFCSGLDYIFFGLLPFFSSNHYFYGYFFTNFTIVSKFILNKKIAWYPRVRTNLLTLRLRN